MLAQGWPDIVQPTTQNSFYWQKNGVGPTLARCCSADNTKILFTGKKWRWPNDVPMLFNQPNTNLLSAQFFMLVKHWPYVVKPTQ